MAGPADIALVASSFALLLAYHAFYMSEILASQSRFVKSFYRGKRTVYFWALRARRLWAHSVTAHQKDSILGVQTFRNSLMAATFMATTVAVLIQLNVTWLLDRDALQRIEEIALTDPAVDDADRPLVNATVKTALSMVFLFLSLMCFTQSIRMFMHLGNVVRAAAPDVQEPGVQDPEMKKVFRVFLRRAHLYFSLGLRSLYTYVPMVAWLFGPTFFFAFSVALVVVQLAIDLPGIPQNVPGELPDGSGIDKIAV